MNEQYVKNIWMIVKTTVKQIQRENLDLSHDEIYKKATEVVMNKHGFRLYNGLRDQLTVEMQRKVRLEVLQNLDSNFLGKLNEAWIEHQITMRMLSDMLGFMDETYIKQRGLDTVYNLGLKSFRYEIIEFADIKQTLREQLISLIADDRKGSKIAHLEIKTICSMLLTLGIGSRYFYEQIFENVLLSKTTDYYQSKSVQLMEQNRKDYVKEMKSLIAEESERVSKYFDQETVNRIVQIIEDIVEKQQL